MAKTKKQYKKKQELRNKLKSDDKKTIIKQDKKCIYCGCDYYPFLTIDHKQSLAKGGDNNTENLQTCCLCCNKLKGSMSHEDFLVYKDALCKLRDIKKIHIGLDLVVKLHQFIPSTNTNGKK